MHDLDNTLRTGILPHAPYQVGTGKVTATLHGAVAPGGAVVGVDVSTRMIELARAKVARPGLTFVVGDALRLPVEDGAFDAATIAFGMRNLADYRRGFAEMRRAVRPGGRVVCLEIARPRGWAGRLIGRWFDHAIPLLGRVVGHREAYAYWQVWGRANNHTHCGTTRVGVADPISLKRVSRVTRSYRTRWFPGRRRTCPDRHPRR